MIIQKMKKTNLRNKADKFIFLFSGIYYTPQE